MTDQATIAKAAQILCEHAEPRLVILYGSHARGNPRPDSDVDLLVVERQVADRMAEMVRLGRILSPLRMPVDLLVVDEETFRYWSDTPGNIYYTARTEGRVLHEQTA